MIALWQVLGTTPNDQLPAVFQSVEIDPLKVLLVMVAPKFMVWTVEYAIAEPQLNRAL